jgi:hypothetical protein
MMAEVLDGTDETALTEPVDTECSWLQAAGARLYCGPAL